METSKRLKHPPKIKIGTQWVGYGEPVYIIAEAGVNHNGDVQIAKQLVETAKSCGADCVKFQTFKAERVATATAPKARYQAEITGTRESHLEMLKKLELSSQAQHEIADHCNRVGIEFLSTPYNFEDIDLLESIGVNAYKVASGQIIEPEFLKAIARKGKPVIISTGMAVLSEVEQALNALHETHNAQVVVLQCTTDYPSIIEDANLLAIQTMRDTFSIPVGYSDHTTDSTACLVAVGLGACVIEKHITLDKTMLGPDHQSSASPDEFRRLVGLLRKAERALGTGVKEPCAAEKENIQQMRRSIVARIPIAKGTRILTDMLTYKRPASGIKPSLLGSVSGRIARRDLAADHLIDWEDLE